MTEKIEFFIPIKTVSEANAREHWAVKAKRAKAQRLTAWAASPKQLPKNRMAIILTRVAPHDLDTDNLARSFKAVRDGIADALGLDDGDKRLTWKYEQRRPLNWEKAKLYMGKYGVAVEIEP
ncbi:MAG: hypothetical protein HZA50_11730 [Planctomycetes bacterium]|nr:hypothetical protein [Planctomycetota bacterium]